MKNERLHCAVIIPACNEEAGLGIMLDELQHKLATLTEWGDFTICVGVNGTSDRTAQRAGDRGVEEQADDRRWQPRAADLARLGE